MKKAMLLIGPMICLGAAAQPASVTADLFTQTTPLHVKLSFPFDAFVKLRPEEDERYNGTLKVGKHQIPLAVEPRGKSRRKFCRIPPVRLDFKPSQTVGTPFAGQNKLKLVTHCSTSGTKRGWLAAEYTAYRLLNELTDASFRVRWLNITYVDTESGEESTHNAFLIEHKKQLGARLGLEPVDATRFKVSELDPTQTTVVSLFAYMVGNTDFSFVTGPPDDDCCHNLVPFSSGGGMLPIPYDFDSTGLVNPTYAGPLPKLGIKRLTQRLYRGYCSHNDRLAVQRQAFLAKKEQLYAHLQFPPLIEKKRRSMAKFLDKFFDILADDRRYERSILSNCR